MRLADGAASPAYLEFLCIHDSLAAQLPAHHRFLMHGAAIAFDGAAYLFTAPSGTGKTTHVRLWRQYLGSRVTVVNGDKPFLSLEPDGTVRVWGSPWAGKERWQSPISVPLCGVCLLERGTDRICRLPPEQALTPLFRQTYHRDDPALEYLTLGFLDALLRRVPVYRLTCGHDGQRRPLQLSRSSPVSPTKITAALMAVAKKEVHCDETQIRIHSP